MIKTDKTGPFLMPKSSEAGRYTAVSRKVSRRAFCKEHVNQRTKQKLHQLDGIINELHGNFIITRQDKQRMEYLIRNLSLDNANLNTEQQLIMIIIYTKLENNQNRQLSDYQTLLHKYGLTTDSFNRFHFKITQHYIDNYG